MSSTLFALVILHGTSGLAFEPGFTSKEQCLSVYRGPSVWCYEYDPSGVTWTAFFKTPAGGFGSVWRFPNESICQNYIGALRSDVPAACRQLAHPEPCPVSCVAPVQPPTGSIPPPEPKPDPASLDTKPNDDVRVGGKQYTRVAGLTWVERADSFADVSVGPSDLESKDAPWRDKPTPPKTDEARSVTGEARSVTGEARSVTADSVTAEAPKKRVVQGPHYYERAPQPMQGLIDVVMLPWDFLNYPGRRDNW